MASLLAIVALIAINAFFVTAEFSIVSVRRSRIQQLVLEGDTQARTVQNLQRDINRLLSTTQIGITLSCLALGWISAACGTISLYPQVTLHECDRVVNATCIPHIK